MNEVDQEDAPCGYFAKASPDGCVGCANYRREPKLWDCSDVNCTPLERKDWQSVIFLVKPAEQAMNKADKDGWIEWHGGECPVPPDTRVDVKFRDGDKWNSDPANGVSWNHLDDGRDIIAYRIASPPEQPAPAEPSGSKYRRKIIGALVDGSIDVYTVLLTFAVSCPARAHAVKKLLCAGLRGKGDELQDLREARDAIDRAIQIAEGGK